MESGARGGGLVLVCDAKGVPQVLDMDRAPPNHGVSKGLISLLRGGEEAVSSAGRTGFPNSTL